MNKIEKKLFYIKATKNLKIGDELLSTSGDKYEIVKIFKCNKKCIFDPIPSIMKKRKEICPRVSFLLKIREEYGEPFRDARNCICNDGFFTHINGEPIYEPNRRNLIDP